MNAGMITLLVALLFTALGDVFLWKRLDASRKELATAQATAKQWENAAIDCNAGVEVWNAEAETAEAAARAALAKARVEAAGRVAEIERLRAALKAGAEPGAPCPAGLGVAKVREGLR